MFKKAFSFLLFAVLAVPAAAQLQETVYIRGVIPTENVTSLEIKPRFKAKDDSRNETVATVEIKPSFKLNDNWKFGAEIPLSRYSKKDFSQKGLGDIMLSGFFTEYSPDAVFSYGVGAEMTFPTATGRELGDGKAVAEPEVFLVWKLSPHFFIETEYRHIFSYAGSSGRDDIHESRYRMIFGYMSADKWWFEFDPRYTVDYKNKSEAELIGEFELGTMINVGASAYIRGGWHLAGNKYSQDWELMLGFKILYF
ncbi:hypothetical protein [Candidatus Avelusimicrobium alvi]|uniref:hypothetical protein n=1 Tax=Candidatus Avelusimicrobium alvi TaxID=3416221 RepID=UPI003D143B4A